eukprot:CAMPEP_0202692368 /NCGR_PEP_ID=MMETSP1385-20130828/6768_1 /ASSEMBLY_ACC=CAM_ASM_000861 /TAXON_ID=933848 /ORGANISM="Elphidium margaritaceum" /LENGTH=440 /DNA_ID=CAMNT_0049347891 /DNA_START=142 /DNA_END=1464 /DNA_ORIENTATION=-
MGAAGRDFHNFNMKYRDNEDYNVVAFTATQIPGIDDKMYPAELCGKLYPGGIPIHKEDELQSLIAKHQVDDVIFSYSDVHNHYLMERASHVMAYGANFTLLGTSETQLVSTKPVISVLAVRTGCGKSQTSRYIVDYFNKQGLKVVAIRHPMPYGDLVKQKVQRYATMDDLVKHECTIEEREEYEPYIANDAIIYAGVDYEAILREAEKEADIILWDGGNNDMSFIRSDCEITIVDPHRAGHERTYYPGQTNVYTSNIVVVNKIATADASAVNQLRQNVTQMNPDAVIVDAASPISVDEQDIPKIRGKKVLVVEDGPTLTHGGMKYGAGMVAAQRFGGQIVCPRPYLVGTLKETFAHYPDIGTLLPAMGYGAEQTSDLEQTINATQCDVVLSGTPIDLSRVVKVNKPIVRAQYDLQCIGKPELSDVIRDQFKKSGKLTQLM